MKTASLKRKAAHATKGKGAAQARALSWGDCVTIGARGGVYLAACLAVVGFIALACWANMDWSADADPVLRGIQFASIVGGAGFFALAAAPGSKLVGRIGFAALAVVCVAFNIWCAYQNASHRNAEVRDNRRGEISAAQRYNSERAELVAKRDRAAVISQRETSDALEAQIAAVQSSFIWRRSHECSDVTLPDSKAHCDGFRALQTRLAGAREYARADFEIRTLDATRSGKAAPTSATPEIDGLAAGLAFLGFQMSDKGKGVAAVFLKDWWPALMVELFAALGPFSAFRLAGILLAPPVAPLRRPAEPAQPAAVIAPTVDMVAEAVSPVSRFVSEALEPTKGGRIEPGALYEHYRKWCALHGVDALNNNRFGRQAGALIKRDSTKRRQYLGFVLRPHVPAAPRVVSIGPGRADLTSAPSTASAPSPSHAVRAHA